jgi:formate-dependent nitrite reductase membrane component NrfD
MRPLFVADDTRYRDSIDPVETDGRDIDPDLGSLVGEAAQQRTGGHKDAHILAESGVWQNLPSEQGKDITYYDRPLLQKPVWEWAIAAYYYIGGVTGAALVLGAAAQLRDGEANNKLIKRCHSIAFAGSGLSAFCLVYDLGRPERFLNMLRVFRPTSPMNVGAWILSGVGATTPIALLLRNSGGLLGAVGKLFTYLAGIFGAGLATYTGVLVSSSAVPIWQQSRKSMPILFGASAMASVGALFNLITDDKEERALTSSFGAVGQLVELGASYVMEQQASEVERVGLPFRNGLSGAMWKTAAVLTAGSIVVGLLPGKSKTKRVTAGLLGTFGSLLMRFSIEQLGKKSALDARASFHQQRAGKGAAEVVSA